MFKALKKVLPKSIFGRFVLILLTPAILSQLIIGGIFSEKYTKIALGIISKQMAGQAVAIANLLDMNCEQKYIDELKDSMNIRIETYHDSTLEKIGISKNHKVYRSMKRALIKKGVSEYYVETENADMNIYIPSHVSKDIYKISFSRKNLYMKIIPIVLGWGIASLSILIMIAFFFLKNQVRSIKRLERAVDNFGKGIKDDSYIPEGSTEIRHLGNSFCSMKENVKELMNTRLKILAGISHDLKTPLTKMKLQLSLMSKSKEVEWLMNDVDMMINMTESFTHHAAEQNNEVFQNYSILKLLNEISNDFKNTELKIHINSTEDFSLNMRVLSMKRAFSNIVSNAAKFAKNLYISIKKDCEKVYVTFEDDGKGICSSNSNDLFIPFFKENNARTNEKGSGVGLGMSIARDVVIDHSGTISASKSEIYGGAKFEIIFEIQK